MIRTQILLDNLLGEKLIKDLALLQTLSCLIQTGGDLLGYASISPDALFQIRRAHLRAFLNFE